MIMTERHRQREREKKRARGGGGVEGQGDEMMMIERTADIKAEKRRVEGQRMSKD